MTELKPCPCCGSGPAKGFGGYTQASFSGVEVMEEFRKPYVRSGTYVWCGTCGLQTAAFDTEAQAIAAWNTRAAEEGKAELVEKAEALLAVFDGKPCRDGWYGEPVHEDEVLALRAALARVRGEG